MKMHQELARVAKSHINLILRQHIFGLFLNQPIHLPSPFAESIIETRWSLIEYIQFSTMATFPQNSHFQGLAPSFPQTSMFHDDFYKFSKRVSNSTTNHLIFDTNDNLHSKMDHFETLSPCV